MQKRLVGILFALVSGVISFAAIPGSPVTWGTGAGHTVVIPRDLKNPVQIASDGYFLYVLQADGRVQILSDSSAEDYKPPASATNITQISASGYHVAALRRDGTVIAWGSPSVVGQREIITPPKGLSDVVAVAAGWNHSLALKADGTLVTWGSSMNQFGILNVPSGITNAVSVFAGQSISGAILSDGSARFWGALEYYGLVGAATNLTGLSQIAFGSSQTLLLRTNGTMSTKLGPSAPPGSLQPRGLTNVVKVQAGWGQLAAIKSDGSLTMWGYNDQQQATVPASVSNVVDLACPYLLTGALVRAPMLNGGNSNTYVLAGDTLRLDLNPVYDDNYQVTWSRSTESSASLTKTNAQAADGGEYFATISNAYGSASQRVATVTVLPSPPRLLSIEPREALITPGQSASFSAWVAGSEPITYQWHRLRMGTPIELVSTGLELFVVNAVSDPNEDRVYYQLSAQNQFGTFDFLPVAIRFLTSGRFTSSRFDAASATFLMSMTVETNLEYIVEASPDLLSWRPVATLRSNDGVITIGDTIMSSSNRFFRLVSDDPIN